MIYKPAMKDIQPSKSALPECPSQPQKVHPTNLVISYLSLPLHFCLFSLCIISFRPLPRCMRMWWMDQNVWGHSLHFRYKTKVLKTISCWIKLILLRPIDLHRGQKMDILSNHTVSLPANTMLMNRSKENNLNPTPNGF